MSENEDKDRIIALQRKKIEELNKKISVLKQENALLNNELMRLRKRKKRTDL